MSGGIAVQGLRQIAVSVGDLDRAVAFYADTLGMDLQFRNERLAFFDAGGPRLLLAERGSDEVEGIVLYFEVEDIFTAVDSLRDTGVAIEKDPACIARMAGRAMWVAFFRDSEGALAALIAEHADTDTAPPPAAG